MRILTQFLKFSNMTLFCGMLLSCNLDEPEASLEPEPSVNADTISNHLQFINATQIQGTIPNGPAGSSLKISFEDTLFLIDQVATPIKFLHKDETENVAGIYVQVHGAIGGAGATYYYDVPEIPEMADSDTVSVILIGVDPAGLIDPDGVPPVGAPDPFIITITPYDKGHQPIAEDVRTVKISERKVHPGGNGTCGLVLPPGESWIWYFSQTSRLNRTKDNPFYFTGDPQTVFGANGQFIKGNCCDGGRSVYGFCSALDTTWNATLHFATYYQIAQESLVFFDNGTFFRQTFEKSPYAAPAESDFCTSGEGVVYERINHTKYNGNWTIKPITLPPDPEFAFYDDAFQLILLGTSTSPVGGGFGNPGGIIHQLDCTMGVLILLQPDLEGGGQHLYKVYYSGSGIYWYPFSET